MNHTIHKLAVSNNRSNRSKSILMVLSIFCRPCFCQWLPVLAVDWFGTTAKMQEIFMEIIVALFGR